LAPLQSTRTAHGSPLIFPLSHPQDNLSSVGVDPLLDPEGHAAQQKARNAALREKETAYPGKEIRAEEAGGSGSEGSSCEEDDGVWEPQLEFWSLGGVSYLVDRLTLDVFSEDGEALYKWGGEGPTKGAEVPAAPLGEEVSMEEESESVFFKKGVSGTRLAGEEVGMGDILTPF